MTTIDSVNVSSQIVQNPIEAENFNNSVKSLNTNTTKINAYFNKSPQNITQKRSNIIRTVANQIKSAVTKFFDRSPTIKEMCKQIGIPSELFVKLPTNWKEEILKQCLSNGSDIDDKSKLMIIESLNKEIKNSSEKEQHVDLTSLVGQLGTYKKRLESELNQQSVSSTKTKETFLSLGTCFKRESREELKKAIDNLVSQNDGKVDKKLFGNTQETLKENFGVTNAEFYKAWAEAISTTQGGEVIENGSISLKFGKEEVKLNLKFTPQVKMSGFVGDAGGLKHYSSEIQNYSLQKTGEIGNHAVNLWKQDIEVNGQKMQFLRHGCTRGGSEASKEILLNALMLKYGEDAINNVSQDEPLELQFTNVQLMTLGYVADRQMPLLQIDAFNELAKNKPVELTTKDGKTIKVNIGKPLLFDFGVNLQHFKNFEKFLANKSDMERLKQQNLESFKQLFGENFPNIIKAFGETDFNEGSLIKKKLDSLQNNDPKKQQIQTLANQILEIYQSHPEGLKDNPYALPTRVLALTNLLGYASSFNCKSGKDRTGLCSMELSNLCAQIMAGKEINDPMQSISNEEQKNLQAIYKEGSSARDILKINTIFQKNLNIQEYLGFHANEKRFGVDWTKSFEENVKSFAE